MAAINTRAMREPIPQASGGMSDAAWNITATILEKMADIIKGVIVVLGIFAANIADVVMGSIAMAILFGGNNLSGIPGVPSIPGWVFGTLISLGSSAIQIFLWSLMQRRNIGIRQLFNWNKIPSEVKPVLAGTLVIWLIDTLIDISPIALMIGGSEFEKIAWLYKALVLGVFVILFILCGFAEILTSNVRGMLMISASSMGTRSSDNHRSSEGRDDRRGDSERPTRNIRPEFANRIGGGGGESKPRMEEHRERESGEPQQASRRMRPIE